MKDGKLKLKISGFNLSGLTRIGILRDDRNLMFGRDTDQIFEKGMVYEVKEIMGQIIFKPIGQMALTEKEGNRDNNSIISSGKHLITEDEWRQIEHKRGSKN